MKALHLLIFITSIVSCQEKNQLDTENEDLINQIEDNENTNESEEVIDIVIENDENFNEIEIFVECPKPMVQEFSFKLFDANGVDLIATQKYNFDDISLYAENQKSHPIALEPNINSNSLLSAFHFERHGFYSLNIKEKAYIIVLDLILEEGSSSNSCKNFIINEVILDEQIQCIECSQKEYVTLTLN